MTVRVLMFSVVASLGLALPSGESLNTWSCSGQAWLNARLTEWGTNEPVDERAFVFVADAVELAPAPAERVVNAIPDAVAKPAPQVDLLEALGPDELLELEAALEEKTETVVEAPQTAQRTEFFFAEELAAELEEWWQGEVLELEAALEEKTETVVEAPQTAQRTEFFFAEELAAELEEWWQGEEIAADTTVEVADLPAWLSAKLAEWTGLALIDEDAFVLSEEVATAIPSPVIGQGIGDREFEGVVDEMVVSFTRDLAASGGTGEKVAEQVPAEEPLEVGDDLYPGIAFDLNREAEVVTASPPSPSDTAPAPEPTAAPEQRLTHALRLTREAVNAWANLLHGPAIVTISR